MEVYGVDAVYADVEAEGADADVVEFLLAGFDDEGGALVGFVVEPLGEETVDAVAFGGEVGVRPAGGGAGVVLLEGGVDGVGELGISLVGG